MGTRERWKRENFSHSLSHSLSLSLKECGRMIVFGVFLLLPIPIEIRTHTQVCVYISISLSLTLSLSLSLSLAPLSLSLSRMACPNVCPHNKAYGSATALAPLRRRPHWAAPVPALSAPTQGCNSVAATRHTKQCHFKTTMDTLGIEPRASRMLSGCDTTTPCAQVIAHSRPTLLPIRDRPFLSAVHCHARSPTNGARAPGAG